MALLITNECISCDACVSVCPNQAITQGSSIYVVNPELCTECVGAEDEPQCRTVCPVECIIDDPDRRESRDELQAKYQRLHS
ncbi:MAG TPA: YfhL family 4Fe-4S dicluster ferredoxin [Azospirillum sp.]|nr:YfhL family 4Fe-4S dicluster ferredoxin [Azospirillum sp.]